MVDVTENSTSITGNVDSSHDATYLVVGGKRHVTIFEKDDTTNWISQKQFDVNTRKYEFETSIPKSKVSMSESGQRVAFTADENNVQVYDRDGNDWFQIGSNISIGGELKLGDMALSGDGSHLVLGFLPESSFYPMIGALKVYKFNGTDFEEIDTVEKRIDCGCEFERVVVAISSDGFRVAVGNAIRGVDCCYDGIGQVQVYENNGTSLIDNGSFSMNRCSDQDFGRVLAMSDDGSRIIAGSQTRYSQVNEYTGSGWNQLGEDLKGDRRHSVAISGDGNRIAIKKQDSERSFIEIYEYNEEEWEVIGQTEPINDFTTSFIFSSDGSHLIVAQSGVVTVHKSANGNPCPRSSISFGNLFSTMFSSFLHLMLPV